MNLYIKNSNLQKLNASLGIWHDINMLTFCNSSVKNISGQFQGKLNSIILPSVELSRIDAGAFLKINLRSLNVSNNNLTTMPQISSRPLRKFTLDISGNDKMWCHSVIELIDQLGDRLNFSNKNKTLCVSSQKYDWFNSTETMPLVQVVVLKKLKQYCPRTETYECRCEAYRLEIVPGQFPTNLARVDCSGQNLTALPPILPPNTHILNVSNNNIKSIDALGIGETYQDIRHFYADNNEINSISGLEGSRFIQNFEILSLRSNKLTSIPIYFLSNAFSDINAVGRNVKLGGNKLNCDCSTAQELKVWLVINKASITDYDEVLCSDSKKVVHLKVDDLCVVAKDWTYYISYIITVEVSLLVLLISKVSYDYWIFKTKGYLPWPASKMPKLPCDWVCES
ncbi:hypothetical protein AAG570_010463 [Ranatra chinensis]|uniref:Protein halfway n=1 Tax=Ranatra chinensis TaxID=642074 RepID=A0ABD0Z4P9_9HEMI